MKDKTHTPVSGGPVGFKPQSFFADGGTVEGSDTEIRVAYQAVAQGAMDDVTDNLSKEILQEVLVPLFAEEPRFFLPLQWTRVKQGPEP